MRYLLSMNIHFRFIALVALTVVASISRAADNDNWISTTSGCMVSASNSIAKNVKVSWTGNCSDGYADGKGILSWSNGNRYEGDLYVGVISGSGTFYWANGDWYAGAFKDGRRDGIGTQHYGCAGRYQGEFHKGVMDGVGVLYMADGNRYEGTFHHGIMEGFGMRHFADGSSYEGEFKNNQQAGLGTLLLANHSRYEGEFKANRPEGHALVTDANGNLYEGMYVDGHVDDRGILTKPNGERDVGIFKDPHGTLKLVSTIGPPLYEPCQTFCNTSTLSCGGAVTASVDPSDPAKMMDAAVACGREIQQCVTMCQHQNPTIRELKGIVEVGEVDAPTNTPTAGDSAHDATISTNHATVNFADEQIAASNALRSRLAQQHQQLQTLQQKLASLPAATTTATMPASKSASDCRSLAHHRN